MLLVLVVGVAFIVAIILNRILPKTEMLADDGKNDVQSRILDALSAFALREIRPEDFPTPTTRLLTPRDLLSAISPLEDELDLEIPRSVYWQDTIGDVVASLTDFVEESSTTPSATKSQRPIERSTA